MQNEYVGWIGLGNIGHVMAERIASVGHALIVADPVNASRAPEGARVASSNGEVAENAETIFLCLPDGAISIAVCRELLAVKAHRIRRIVNTSTTGMPAAQELANMLAPYDIDYIDSPVSGGVAGARAGTLAVIMSGAPIAISEVERYLESLGKIYSIGEHPGQAQALKLLNNFLAGAALVAASEAVAFGVACGLDMSTILEVVNNASGRNTATMIKFPNEIVNERYSGGFGTELFAKDLRLYLESVSAIGAPNIVAGLVGEVWEDFGRSDPGTDSTRIYQHIRDKGLLKSG